MNTRKAVKIIIITALLALYVTALLEMGLRLCIVKPLIFKISVSGIHGKYMLSSDPKLIYQPRPNTGELNQYGHRGAVHAFKKLPNQKRVVFMGDSVVDGLGIGVEDRLSDVLSRRTPWTEFVNLAVSGYSLSQEIEYVKTFGYKFEPDYVFWGICCNDLDTCSAEFEIIRQELEKSAKNGFYRRYYAAKRDMAAIAKASAIYTCAKYVISKKADGGLDYTPTTTPAEIDALLDEAGRLSKRYHFTNVFIFLPANTPQFDEKMKLLRERIDGKKLVYWDYLKAFRGLDKKQLYLDHGKDPWHMTGQGNALLADMLEPRIRELFDRRGLSAS